MKMGQVAVQVGPVVELVGVAVWPTLEMSGRRPRQWRSQGKKGEGR
jgi:hypothetical protein